MYSAPDGSGGTTVDKLDLQIRDHRVTSFLVNGREPEPLLARDGQRLLDAERRQRESYDIAGLFDDIEELMKKDQREGTGAFLRARFDKTDGHVTSFSRQLRGKRNPHLVVEMKRVN